MSEKHLHALPKGFRIEEYEIVRVLGVGGFGITYLVFDHKLDGPVALKEYFPAGFAVRAGDHRVVPSAPEHGEMFAWGLDGFIEEARTIHRFRHRNVVRVHRYIEVNSTACIVMEYVEGESLAALLKNHGTMTPPQWRPWMESLLDGLDCVHRHDYLHRDIKPENIVIRAVDNEPVLIDFGAARRAAVARTRHLTAVLTPGYAPIEQYSASSRQGPGTDIYGLAAVSYRALTGESPPPSPDRVLDDRYSPLAEQVGGRDRAWLEALDRGMALRPEDRPEAVSTWRAMLAKARGTPSATVNAPPHGTKERSPPAVPHAVIRDKQSSGRLLALTVTIAVVVGLAAMVVRDAPLPDVSASLAVADVTTGWLDVGLDNFGRSKLVPTISFTLRNISESHVRTLRLNGVFRCEVAQGGEPPVSEVSPANPEAGTCAGEVAEWGNVYLHHAVGREGLDPGALAGPFTMEADVRRWRQPAYQRVWERNGRWMEAMRRRGEQPRVEMLQHRDFVDVKVELFVKHRADPWVRLGEHPIDRQLLTQ